MLKQNIINNNNVYLSLLEFSQNPKFTYQETKVCLIYFHIQYIYQNWRSSREKMEIKRKHI